jgi:hypothetical protein
LGEPVERVHIVTLLLDKPFDLITTENLKYDQGFQGNSDNFGKFTLDHLYNFCDVLVTDLKEIFKTSLIVVLDTLLTCSSPVDLITS